MTSVPLGLPVVPSKAARPSDAGLIDRFGRRATDLRVSLIDKCNLRCTYCMPAEGLPWLSRSELLSGPELIRLITIAVRDMGIAEVRFTGGEPLLRQDLPEILAATAKLNPAPEMSLTTNGITLAKQAADLVAAGLTRINVSLDTLRQDRFAELTRRDRLADVLSGLKAAKDAGLSPVKVNTVLLRGINDDEPADLLEFCLENGYQLRFIEQMPLDPQHGWDRTQMITETEILDRLRTRFQLAPHPEDRGSAPAQRWLVDGGPGTVGVISSVTEPFCASCDRTRLTADGTVRNCLFAQTETDLRGPLRSGATDAEIAELWRGNMWQKAAGHGINDRDFAQPERPMSAIGG
ncbi:GTP 3',8-cyclase MoaA [Pseudonocardiaceae bacterium YIM PH 21723]|nr:GTP 3',8-cyclase MoaA [Pseudonocardiaceae bacterium YIM PH 21723]